MAHNCPECDQACYCGGDIDDCLFEDSDEESACTCCLGKDDDYEDEWDEPEDRCPGCDMWVNQGDSHDSECSYG